MLLASRRPLGLISHRLNAGNLTNAPRTGSMPFARYRRQRRRGFSHIDLVFDTDNPISTVTFPIDGDVQQNPIDIDGSASDVGPAGLQKVQISLRLDNAPRARPRTGRFYLDPSSSASSAILRSRAHRNFGSTPPAPPIGVLLPPHLDFG